MELPHLGNHCSEPTCKKLGMFTKFVHFFSLIFVLYFSVLDFLPVKCDGCPGIFW